MIKMYTINEIKQKIRPITIKYGLNTIILFGSYAKGIADENSDLDFVMDKGNIKDLLLI